MAGEYFLILTREIKELLQNMIYEQEIINHSISVNVRSRQLQLGNETIVEIKNSLCVEEQQNWWHQ